MRYSLLTLALLGCLAPCRAQLPPGLPIPAENYAAPHLFGSPNALSMNYVALGGAYVAEDRDDWHGNPAGLASVVRPTLHTYFLSAGFERLPTIRTSLFAYAMPVGPGAFKISYSRVRASGGLAGTPISTSVHEDDPAVEYGWRANKQLTLGVGTAYLRTRSKYTVPSLGAVTVLRSRPTTLGGRVGAIYSLGERLSLGAALTIYQEHVSQAVPVLRIPDRSLTFNTRIERVGLAFRPDASSRILLDYESSRVSSKNVRITRRPVMLGAERRIGEAALRLGSYDGKLTGGLGWERRNARLSYAFTNRFDKDLEGRGAKTAHGIELTVGL
jgi:hypothetical protein